MIFQKIIQVKPLKRGMNLITDQIQQGLGELPKQGLLNIFLKHTSASLTISENADSSVQSDMEKAINLIAPENQPFYQHTAEGPDDMPAHIKSSLLGVSLTIPIENSKLALGVWQGIYLFEHRNQLHKRNMVLTIYA